MRILLYLSILTQPCRDSVGCIRLLFFFTRGMRVHIFYTTNPAIKVLAC